MSTLNFIGVGAQKAGTTWLYDQLRNLEDFKLTPIKELHYFDRGPEYISPDFVEITKFKDRLHNYRWYKRFIKDIGRTIKDGRTLSELGWVFKWHFTDYSDEAYEKLFKGWKTSGLKGEITPSYSMLEIEDIKRIRAIFPDVKIVFLLRDPITRAWSHCRYRKPDVMSSIDSIKDFIDGDEQSLRGNYLRTIDNFSSVFPKDQILIGYFDGIKENPKQLLKEIVSFLGGDERKVEYLKNIQKRSNASVSVKLPDEIQHHLLMKYEDMITELSSRYNGFSSVWMAKHYDKVINSDLEKLKYTFHP